MTVRPIYDILILRDFSKETIACIKRMAVGNISIEGKKIEIDCYHGTTSEDAKKIMLNREFINSNKDNEWLGIGAYFFHEKKDAQWWTTHKRFKGQDTSVLGCLLQVNENEILDLDDQETLRNMKKSVILFLAKSKGMGANMEDMKEHERQCFFCNTVQKLLPQISLRSFTFSPPFRQSNLSDFGFSEKKKQYCVVKQRIITSISEETRR